MWSRAAPKGAGGRYTISIRGALDTVRGFILKESVVIHYLILYMGDEGKIYSD